MLAHSHFVVEVKKVKRIKNLNKSSCYKMDLERCLRISTLSAGTPSPSEISPTPSLDSTGSDQRSNKYLEEDNLDDDTTNVVSKNTRCLICNYVFDSEADFVKHGRVHFGNTFQNEVPEWKKPPPYGTTSHHPSPVYPGMSLSPALPPPPPMYNWNPYTCSVCHVGFNSYDILMCHVKLYHCHQQFTYADRPLMPHNLLQPYYNPHHHTPLGRHDNVARGVCPKPQIGKKCSCSDCQRTKTSNPSDRPQKRKRVEKEDFDEATLAKMREMEWERRKGYWCNKCSTRFDSQNLLVDHMSSKEHAEAKK